MATRDERSRQKEPDAREIEAEWDQELERRAREVLDGTVKTVAWKEIEARITRKLRQRR
ncbi:addiction module protein [Archangium gephyra]|uniref:addiction module protein n=1 Tax=Archangium gephyra TaxID=48 RepID=UPI0035D4DBCA